MNNIRQFLQGKNIFITGATGFLGQPLLEKILWSVPQINRLYLLIRPQLQLSGRVMSAQERLEKELFQSSAFDRLSALHGDRLLNFLQEKMVAVAGDISEENLGLDPKVRSALHQDIDVVINSAAVVSFDAPLDDALHLNVQGARRVTEFAASCRKATLVHVSTAYVSGGVDESVPETIYHTARDQGSDPFPERRFRNIDQDIGHIEKLIAEVRAKSGSPELEREFKRSLIKRFRKSPRGKNVRRREKIENLRKKWIQNHLSQEGMKWARQRGWNDTYTYTKALGEQMVVRYRQDIPTVIIRPSVIESSLSEPSPGWLDGLRMADPLIVAIGKGRLRSLPLNPNVIIDLVPVDMVVNSLLASIPEAGNGGLHIYQVATGSQNPITLGQLYDFIYRYFVANPMLDKTGHPIRLKRLKFPNPATFRLQHRLRSVPLDTAERTLERLSSFDATHKFKRRISATKAAHQKLYYYGEIYEPYLNLNCRFEVDNVIGLLNSLTEEEQRLFNFDVTRLNWRHYVQNVHILGVKKYILKVEGEGTLEVDDNSPSEGLPVSTLYELLCYSADRFTQKTALQVRREGRWERVTYAELKRAVDQIGHRLHQRGLSKGDRVILYSENQPDWGVAYLGAVSMGLVMVPLDAQTWRKEVWSVARFTQARAILASENCFKRLSANDLEENNNRQAPVQLLNVNRACSPFFPTDESSGSLDEGLVEFSQGSSEIAPIKPDDLASIIFTTGTAVDPRGVMHTHRNFLNNLLGVNRYLPVRETDHLLSVLPLSHVLEFTCGFLMALHGGATITYLRSLKPRNILEIMRETGTSCMLGVPTLYALIREDIERRVLGKSRSAFKSNLMETSKQLSKSVERTFHKNIGRQLFSRVHQEFGGKIRVFVSGGSSLGEKLYDDFKALGMPIYEGYGLTETAPVLTVNPLYRSRKGSAGKPLPGVELRIFHPDKDGVGEVIVRSPSLMLGYFKNPEATRRAIRNDWFHTGDLGWVDEDGYLYITGRIKHVIVTGAGKNVYPEDLEAIYKTIPQIEEVCVLGIKSGLTEDVHAVIVPHPGCLGGLDSGQVRKTIQQEVQKVAGELPTYQRLQAIHIWPGPLPQKTSGGLSREAVRRKLVDQLRESRRSTESAGQSPQLDKKLDQHQALLEEFSRLFRVPVEEINSESHLYADLGLDSLMAIELLLILEHRFGISIADEKAARFQTVGDLLQVLRSDPSLHPATSQEVPIGRQVRSVLPYSQRSAIDHFLLGISFSGLKTFYRTYFDLKFQNYQSLPQGIPYILAANHTSHLDAPAILSALSSALGIREAQKLHVLAARDYFFDTSFKSWFFSTFLNLVPIERQETSLSGLRTVKAILSGGEPVLFFPEGTRSRTGEIQGFRPGFGLVAFELDVPIIPVYIGGTHQCMPVGRLVPRPKQVKVIFGQPITMQKYRSSKPEVRRDELYRKIATDVRQAVKQLANGST